MYELKRQKSIWLYAILAESYYLVSRKVKANYKIIVVNDGLISICNYIVLSNYFCYHNYFVV